MRITHARGFGATAAASAVLPADVAKIGAECAKTRDAKACAKAAATSGVLAACAAATGGTLAVACGPLAGVLGPFLGGFAADVLGDGWAVFGYGLEAVGLKDKPDFKDIADPMFANAFSAFNQALDKVTQSLTKTIMDHRAQIGLKAGQMTVVATAKNKNGTTWTNKSALAGKTLPVSEVVRRAFVEILSSPVYFGTAWKHNIQCGWVQVGQRQLTGQQPISEEDFNYILSGGPLSASWSINCTSVLNRGSAFEQGAKMLASDYAHLMSAITQAVEETISVVLFWESQNPATLQAMKKKAPPRVAFTRAPVATKSTWPSGQIAMVAVIGLLAVTGVWFGAKAVHARRR